MEENNRYQENGYENRSAYLRSLAGDYGVAFRVVAAIADLYGPNEDFDGLVTALDDMGDMEHCF